MLRHSQEHTVRPASSSRKRNALRTTRGRFAFLRSPVFGYLASLLLVGLLVVIEKVDEGIPDVSFFIGTPFALLAILVALLWGTGPALVALVFGLLVVIKFISPDALTVDILRDVAIVGPFIALHFVSLATILWLERSRRELQRKNQQIARANALKDYVLTRAAHELRTPLTTMLGRTQLLSARLEKSGQTPETWAAFRRYLEIMEVRSLHLRSLLDSLSDLSRVRAEGMAFPLPLRDLGNLCREVITDQHMLAGRVIELDCPDSPILLAADEERLSQMLIQLVSNALKYSPADSPVMVRLQRDDHTVTICVHNDGSALSPEQIEHLFDPFYRTSEVEYSQVPGWGLGLTISQEIVEQHGGRIWVESSEGKGTTFFITLPLPTAAE